jgi:hypothetical protein
MFDVNVDKTKYHVSFFHEDKVTECFITVPELEDTENEFVSFGYAMCKAPDIYCKNTGRKLALKHALEAGKFSRELRKVIWERYFEKRNGKKD